MQSSSKGLLVALACCSAVSASADAGSPPSTAATYPCVCDCNGDGVVLGNEATIFVQILAGNRDLEACPSFDAASLYVFPPPFLGSLCLNNLANGCPGEEPPAPECICDCNHDGEVLGNEVTTAINIVAGNLPLSACPSIECPSWPGGPGNCGTVCINNVATSCPR